MTSWKKSRSHAGSARLGGALAITCTRWPRCGEARPRARSRRCRCRRGSGSRRRRSRASRSQRSSAGRGSPHASESNGAIAVEHALDERALAVARREVGQAVEALLRHAVRVEQLLAAAARRARSAWSPRAERVFVLLGELWRRPRRPCRGSSRSARAAGSASGPICASAPCERALEAVDQRARRTPPARACPSPRACGRAARAAHRCSARSVVGARGRAGRAAARSPLRPRGAARAARSAASRDRTPVERRELREVRDLAPARRRTPPSAAACPAGSGRSSALVLKQSGSRSSAASSADARAGPLAADLAEAVGGTA